MLEQTSTGAETAGEEFNWKAIHDPRKGSRDENRDVTILMKEIDDLYIKKNNNVTLNENNRSLPIIVKTFNDFLEKNKIKFRFTNQTINIQSSNKKLTSKEKTLLQIKEANTKKEMEQFILTLKLNNEHMPCKPNNSFEAFFVIIYWTISLIENKRLKINESVYFNCSISLYKAINDSNYLTEDIKNESINLLKIIQGIITDKNSDINAVIHNNSKFLLECYWDTLKHNSVTLYQEQKDVIETIINKCLGENVNNNLTNIIDNIFLLYYKTPPGSGKTFLAVGIAKVISNLNKRLRNKKIFVYICYNTIVRNELAKLCITHNVDIKFWLAISKINPKDLSLETLFRPYKNCYEDWNKKNQRTKDQQKKYDQSRWKMYSPNLIEQFTFFINETRRISEQHRDVEDPLNADNLPDIVIADLNSANSILEAFPKESIIVYFDEAFASSELLITAKIMKNLRSAVLVSATLSDPEETPTFLNDFRMKYNLTDDSFLKVIRSNRQYISCTFVNEDGNIFAPHDYIENMESLAIFINQLEDPLIKRAYSPEVVLNFVKVINKFLPDEMKFENRFSHFGMLNHDSIREYACNILKFISETNNEQLFITLKSVFNNKIKNMDVNTIFTSSAINYQNAKTLHVANNENFNLHIKNISDPFLSGSPNMSSIILDYERNSKIIEDEIKSLEKNGNKDSEYLIIKLKSELDNLELSWPKEFILNTTAHANKFGNYSLLTNPNILSFVKKDDLGLLEETREKLLFSGVGIYQPDDFNTEMLDIFLRKKDLYKLIIATPAIVYGTNIGLSLIDIDKSFLQFCTKNTLYQVIGRAGRRGKSDSALIIFRSNKMIDLILKNNEVNIEAIQIENNYMSLSN